MSDPETVASLGVLIHNDMCGDALGCPRWNAHPRHRDYYTKRADVIMGLLEPEIGPANVFIACHVIIEELLR